MKNIILVLNILILCSPMACLARDITIGWQIEGRFRLIKDPEAGIALDNLALLSEDIRGGLIPDSNENNHKNDNAVVIPAENWYAFSEALDRSEKVKYDIKPAWENIYFSETHSEQAPPLVFLY